MVRETPNEIHRSIPQEYGPTREADRLAANEVKLTAYAIALDAHAIVRLSWRIDIKDARRNHH